MGTCSTSSVIQVDNPSGLVKTTITVVAVRETNFSLMGYILLVPVRITITTRAFNIEVLVTRTIVKKSGFTVASFKSLVRVFIIDCLVILVPATTEVISTNLIITRESFARIFVTLIQLVVAALGLEGVVVES